MSTALRINGTFGFRRFMRRLFGAIDARIVVRLTKEGVLVGRQSLSGQTAWVKWQPMPTDELAVDLILKDLATLPEGTDR